MKTIRTRVYIALIAVLATATLPATRAEADGFTTFSELSAYYVQQREGGGAKPGSILVLNDHPTSNLSAQVLTKWTNMWIVDLFTGDTNTLVQTDGTGSVTLGAANHNFRLYGLTNSLWEIENE